MAKKLVEDFNGIVPDDFELLQTLPGVGRKTANVMEAVAFKRPAMPVDTHVFRVADRIGLVTGAKHRWRRKNNWWRIFLPSGCPRPTIG